MHFDRYTVSLKSENTATAVRERRQPGRLVAAAGSSRSVAGDRLMPVPRDAMESSGLACECTTRRCTLLVILEPSAVKDFDGHEFFGSRVAGTHNWAVAVRSEHERALTNLVLIADEARRG